MSRSHVLFAFACNFHLREQCANMSKVLQILLLSMLLFPYAALISLAMSLSPYGSLRDLAADTHTHFLALPRRPHSLHEATYRGGMRVGEVVVWAKGLRASPTLSHIDMRESPHDGALRKKGWTTDVWHQVQLALPELRAVRLIPAPKRLTPSWGSCCSTGRGS